ncbi:MAG TPA: redoxin domain-containing protein [Thermoanaerobaculia bacterium]|jgi:peroxiredoxin
MRKTAAIALFAVASFGSILSAGELAPGTKAPAFSLVNAVDGEIVTLQPADGKLKVLVFTSDRCEEAMAFEPRLIEIANRFGHKGAHLYLVNAGGGTMQMKARAEEQEYPFPYVDDSDGSVARAYGVRVAPDVFVLDGEGVVRYHGYIDDSAKPAERTAQPLTGALNALLNGREVANAETQAFGCAIR